MPRPRPPHQPKPKRRTKHFMTNHNPQTTALPIHAPEQKAKRWTALAVLMLPVLLVSIDNTVLAFAVPAIAEALSPSSAEQLWIVDSYSLVLAALLVPMGAIGDRIGRRKLLLIGSTGFAVISALAAFTPSALLLVVARALLGIFGAMLMPATLSIIRNVFADANERRIAIAVWATGFSAGAALGPIVGGFLLEHFYWGSVFLMALPILVPFLILAPMTVPESKDPNPSPVDPLSILLIMVGMTGITYGLTHTSENGFDAVAISTILGGLVFIVLFVLRQLNREKNDIQPMLDVRLFRNPVFTGAIAANMISMMVAVGFIYFASQAPAAGLRPGTHVRRYAAGSRHRRDHDCRPDHCPRGKPIPPRTDRGVRSGTQRYRICGARGSWVRIRTWSLSSSSSCSVPVSVFPRPSRTT